MKILICGGSGFIGSRLIQRLLEEGFEVLNFDKRPSSTYPDLTTLGDIRDGNALKQALKGVDTIVNLAAEHADNVSPISLYYSVNVDGSKELVEAAKESDCKKIIFTSSVAIYPLNSDEPREDTKAHPFNDYGNSKLLAEKVYQNWQGEEPDKRDTLIIRPCVVFGERNRGNFYNLMKQIYEKKFLMVGDGKNSKSLCYVGNLVEFIISQIHHKPGLKYVNFADKPDLTTLELFQVITDAMNFPRGLASKIRIPRTLGLLAGSAFDIISTFLNQKLPLSRIRIEKFTASTTINTDKLRKLGYKPKFSLEEAIQKTIEFEFKNKR